MSIRFKVDEDLPNEITERLRASGYDALSVADEKMLGASDQELWETVRREKRCLLTGDKGFADIRRFPPGTHNGIVLFRLPRESRTGYIRLLESMLGLNKIDSFTEAIVTISPEAIRVRRRS